MTITAARQFQQSLIVPGHKECPFEWAVTSQSLWGSAILKGHYATAEQTDTRSSQQSRVWHKNISLYPTFVINASTDIGIKKLPLGPCKRMKARRLWQAIEGPPANLDRRSSMACRADTSHANKAKLETCFTMPCDRCAIGVVAQDQHVGPARPSHWPKHACAYGMYRFKALLPTMYLTFSLPQHIHWAAEWTNICFVATNVILDPTSSVSLKYQNTNQNEAWLNQF